MPSALSERSHPAVSRQSGHYLLVLREDAVLGDALGALAAEGVDVLTCTEERSEIEQAFLSLAGEADNERASRFRPRRLHAFGGEFGSFPPSSAATSSSRGATG